MPPVAFDDLLETNDALSMQVCYLAVEDAKPWTVEFSAKKVDSVSEPKSSLACKLAESPSKVVPRVATPLAQLPHTLEKLGKLVRGKARKRVSPG